MLTIADLRRLESKIETLAAHVGRREHPLEHILKELQVMSKSFDDLKAQVAANTSATMSAISLIGGLSSQLSAAIAAQKAGDDGAALDDLDAQLKGNTDALAAAVLANTPAAPPAPSTPPAAQSTT